MPTFRHIRNRYGTPPKLQVKGRSSRGDLGANQPKPRQSQDAPTPTEPCPICLEVVGLPAADGSVESWSILPCGHRFGSYCAKAWLGTGPMSDPADIQIGDDRVPGSPNPRAPSIEQEAPHEQEVDEAVALGQANEPHSVNNENDNNAIDQNNADDNQEAQGPGQAEVKSDARVAAPHVPSSPSGIQPPPPDEPGPDNNGEADVVQESVAAPEAENIAPPAIVAAPQQQHLPTLAVEVAPAEPDAAQPAQQPETQPTPPAAAPAVAPDEPFPLVEFDDYDLMVRIIRRSPNRMPMFMTMAYPETVNLKISCAFCYMGIEYNRHLLWQKVHDMDRRDRPSRIPGKKLVVTGAKHLTHHSHTAYRAIRAHIGNNRHRYAKPTADEKQTVDAYVEACKEAHDLDFGPWWAQQPPKSDPAMDVRQNNPSIWAQH
ncbi:hypothetical protein SPBR_03494 [Sporothrix brasiliensis 5110]|uniref:RING-type domain-containing protein n=1 Tax=Sporothrix brasiliensis 5110 TaxID=1398154 RepID=A0A0C2FVK3_9PEZI|nr:uncharacterized protein SPBR_03494 [Sporothrix brasiliensis 5110]KIH95053.1 hypothetical protein SPBR_03494 [Sporothrix brasiliensis 5110]